MPALRPLAVIIGATFLATACAPVGSTDGADGATRTAASPCFFSRNINGFSEAKYDSVQLNVSGRRTFKAETLSWCQDLDTAMAISVTGQAGQSRICVGDLANIHIRGTGPQALPCRVRITEEIMPVTVVAVEETTNP